MRAAAAFLAASLLGSPALAATRFEALVIGNNLAPAHSGLPDPEDGPAPLRFADDDAAAFYDFIVQRAPGGLLLTSMDRDTQALYPGLVPIATAPTVAALKAAVATLRGRIERHRRDGDRSEVIVFFSGHGWVGAGGVPELALADGGITQDFLYREILEQLPADAVHLLIDACHAEAVVRPRDAQARRVAVTAGEAATVLIRTTLARYARVGAILASASDGQAHEWDQIRQGVFTYELLSALRGGADVNGDGRLEYSEVYAFLAAANRGVDNPLARLSVVARPPDSDRRAAIVDLATFANPEVARVVSIPSSAGKVQISDDAGRQLATVHHEPGLAATLLVPAHRTIYLRAGVREATFRGGSGQSISFASLKFVALPTRSRGALDAAVRRGLFATTFGRGYYQGFIDGAPDFVPVALPTSPDTAPAATSAVGIVGRNAAPFDFAFGVGVSNAVSRQLSPSAGLRIGLRPSDLSGWRLSLDVSSANADAVREWKSLASFGWQWGWRLGPTSPYVGAAAGVGAILQAPDSGGMRGSFSGAAGPVLGVSAALSQRVRLWSEAELPVLVYRIDGGTSASLAPAIWLGSALGI